MVKLELDVWRELWERAGSQGLDTWRELPEMEEEAGADQAPAGSLNEEPEGA